MFDSSIMCTYPTLAIMSTTAFPLLVSKKGSGTNLKPQINVLFYISATTCSPVLILWPHFWQFPWCIYDPFVDSSWKWGSWVVIDRKLSTSELPRELCYLAPNLGWAKYYSGCSQSLFNYKNYMFIDFLNYFMPSIQGMNRGVMSHS